MRRWISDSQEEANQLGHLAKHVLDDSGPLCLAFAPSNALGVTAILKHDSQTKHFLYEILSVDSCKTP